MDVPHLLFFVLDIAAAVTATLIAARLIISFPRGPNALLMGLILFNTVCHILLARYQYRGWTPSALQLDLSAAEPALNFLRNTTPGLVMILSCRLFQDRPAPPSWLLALFAFQLMLEARASFFVPVESYGLLEQTAPGLLQTAFIGFGLYWTIADWRSDLVDVRRRDRAIAAIIIGAQIIVGSLLLRAVIPGDTVANYFTHMGTIVVALVFNVVILTTASRGQIARHLGLVEPAPVRLAMGSGSLAQASEPRETVNRLKSLLEDEKIYREPGLSLPALARRVGLPEYRLRRLIHETLGFRNFNAFMHDYRIREACVRLRDPAERRTPILTIALSVGYQSINTFNRGFRDVMGVTPSDYRGGDAPPTVTPDILIPKPE